MTSTEASYLRTLAGALDNLEKLKYWRDNVDSPRITGLNISSGGGVTGYDQVHAAVLELLAPQLANLLAEAIHDQTAYVDLCRERLLEFQRTGCVPRETA